ncbi:MAG: hypothetical protein AAF936_11560 [Pseudomonadota bacterium]
MSKLIHLAAAGVFAAVAAASLVGLATAAPQAETEKTNSCQKTLCLVAFF